MTLQAEQEKKIIKLLDRSNTFLSNYMNRLIEKHGPVVAVSVAGNLGSRLMAISLMLTHYQNKNVQQMLNLLLDCIQHHLAEEFDQLLQAQPHDTCRPLH